MSFCQREKVLESSIRNFWGHVSWYHTINNENWKKNANEARLSSGGNLPRKNTK